MIFISNILRHFKNLFPYFLLIAVYFFFVNLEARKDINNQNADEENISPEVISKTTNEKLRIRIPVIPYGQ